MDKANNKRGRMVDGPFIAFDETKPKDFKKYPPYGLPIVQIWWQVEYEDGTREDVPEKNLDRMIEWPN